MVLILYLVHYDTLLQNAITILLQKATKAYYKMKQLLQNALILLQNVTFITNCDVYYKMRRYPHALKTYKSRF